MKAAGAVRMRRREFLGLLAAGGAACLGLGRGLRAGQTAPAGRPDVRFGAVADVQYEDIPAKGKRSYRESLGKLEACVKKFNDLRPDFVIQLGDLINGNFAGYGAVMPIYEKLSMPRYHVLGNHDFAVAPEDLAKVLPRLGLDKLGPGKGYYDFGRAGWRLVVLNGNAVSLHASAPGSEGRKAAERLMMELRKKGARNTAPYSGAVGEEQREWLKATLDRAAAAGERSVVFCHFPTYPVGPATLWDAAEVVAVLESSKGVAAYVCGHTHEGGYAVSDGIHYVTLMGMVETEPTAYALIEAYPDRLAETGFGREPSRELQIPKQAGARPGLHG
jgi:3',5'-cyclic AMP phosphodiesterase CpdA